MIELKNITKTYCSKSNTKICALNDISLIFPQKGLFFIVGKSGCGKTTLLNIIGGLDAPTSGEIYFKKEKIDLNNPSIADNYRKQSIGFVFQDFNLLDDETIIENVDIAAQLFGLICETYLRNRIYHFIIRFSNQLCCYINRVCFSGF